MKKLNITKEAFEKSQYFKNKYGTLKYVSESGRYFKTNKGQMLKFIKESRTSNWVEVDLVWNSENDSLPDTVFVQVNQGSPSEIDLKYELESRYDAEIMDINAYHVSRIDSLCDCFKWTGKKLKSFDPSRISGKELRATWESARKFGKKFNEGLGDSIKYGWNKIKSGAEKVGHIIGRKLIMQPKGDHIEIWNAKYLSKDEADRANSPVMSGKIVLSSSIDGRYIFEIDGDIDSSVKIGDWMDFRNIDTPHRERGMGYVEKIDGNKLYLRTNKDMLPEKMNEVSGWDLEDEDLTLVNSEDDGDKLYIVKLWWGSGYVLDCYNAYAFSDEEALNYVVAYIEKHDPKSLETIDENANDYLQELVDEGEAASLEEAYEHPYFEETYLWVDATREGAEQGHYIYHENLWIDEYPEKHNHPLAKGVDRSKFTEGRMDADDPVTEEDEEMARWLEQEIENEFGIQCSCNTHNPGEEEHIEIYIGVDEDQIGDVDICERLEKFANKVGMADEEGHRWGEASFTWNNDEEIFGEIWPERLWIG